MFRNLIDTNILYDTWTENINTKLALELIGEPVYILDRVLYELANLLKNSEGTDYTYDVVNEILNSSEVFKILSTTRDYQKEALKIMKKYQINKPKKDYSLVDALQFVLAEKENLILYTLDERMTFFDSHKVKVIKPY